MYISVVGLNHNSAPVEIREHLAFSPAQISRYLPELAFRDGVAEALILSTCNRTEVYTVSGARDEGIWRAKDLLERNAGKRLDSYLYSFRNLDAVRHSFGVAAGLDSMVVGEAQILGQVKSAYDLARSSGTAGKILSQVFQQSISVGKRVRTETAIGEGAASVSHAAVELARKIFGDLRGRTVMLIGAGKMAELAAKNLSDHGAASVLVANRTFERARQLAQKFDGSAIKFDELENWLPRADIVISSTGAPHIVLTREMVRRGMKQRRGKPLFLIDIAVPRDIEPDVHKLEGVFLYNIDDLRAVVDSNIRERQKQIEKAREIVEEETAQFANWLMTQQVIPVISAIRNRAHQISESEVDKALRKLSHLDEKEREQIRAMARAIVNKMLHLPTVRLKERASMDNGSRYIEVMDDLFDLGIIGTGSSSFRSANDNGLEKDATEHGVEHGVAQAEEPVPEDSGAHRGDGSPIITPNRQVGESV